MPLVVEPDPDVPDRVNVIGDNFPFTITFSNSRVDIIGEGMLVDVWMNPSTMANIQWTKAESASVSPSPSEGVEYHAYLDAQFDDAPWNGSYLSLTGDYLTSADLATEGFSGISGSVTFTVPYTGLFDIHIFELRICITGQMFLGHDDFDYDLTLHMGSQELHWSGSKLGTSTCNTNQMVYVGTSVFPPVNVDIFGIPMIDGENQVWYLDYSITDNHPGGNFDEDTHINVFIWCEISSAGD